MRTAFAKMLESYCKDLLGRGCKTGLSSLKFIYGSHTYVCRFDVKIDEVD